MVSLDLSQLYCARHSCGRCQLRANECSLNIKFENSFMEATPNQDKVRELQDQLYELQKQARSQIAIQ